MASGNDPWDFAAIQTEPEVNAPVAAGLPDQQQTPDEPAGTEVEPPRGRPKAEKLPKSSRHGGLPKAEREARAVLKKKAAGKAKRHRSKHRKAVEGIAPGSPAWAENYPIPVGRDRRLTPGESAALRFSAGLYYITDMNGCTVKDMAVLPQFAIVTLPRLEEWCHEDKWIQRRHEKLQSIRLAIEARVGDSIVQKQADILRNIETMFAQAFNMTQPTDKGHMRLEPNSWEGVANFALRAAKAANELRGDLITRLVPAQPEAEMKRQQSASLPTQAILKPEDMRAFAHAMLSKHHSKDLPEPHLGDTSTPEDEGTDE